MCFKNNLMEDKLKQTFDIDFKDLTRLGWVNGCFYYGRPIEYNRRYPTYYYYGRDNWYRVSKTSEIENITRKINSKDKRFQPDYSIIESFSYIADGLIIISIITLLYLQE